MNLARCSRVAICLVLCMFTGCPSSTKPAPEVPPILQASYVDAGGILQWSPSGKPFEVTWQNNLSPCFSSDSMKSDGTKKVVCHAFLAGSYTYEINKDPNKPLPQGKSQTDDGAFSMHVGSCGNCGLDFTRKFKEATPPTKGTVATEVDVSCQANGGSTTVNPQTGPSGVKVGDYVPFSFQGQYDPQLSPMTLTFKGADCSNNPDHTKPFVITGSSGYCQVVTTPTITYSAQSNALGKTCTQSTATLSVSPSQ
jgi:hypothetical protein